LRRRVEHSVDAHWIVVAGAERAVRFRRMPSQAMPRDPACVRGGTRRAERRPRSPADNERARRSQYERTNLVEVALAEEPSR
jgi:hypothetical protein